MDYCGLLWITVDYYGLLWITVDYYDCVVVSKFSG